MSEFVTSIPWETKVKGSCYGTDETYKLAAQWLRPCHSVADWGGGRGHFRKFLDPIQDYVLVDGTVQEADLLGNDKRVLANLVEYNAPTEGILLRHVLEMTADWRQILCNALWAMQKRMVVITFTPNVRETKLRTHHLTWPVYHFNHLDLIELMLPKLISFRRVQTSQPETVYYLEKYDQRYYRSLL